MVNVENIIDGISTVNFRSLSGNFKYAPGQFMHLALDLYDPSTCWPESRCFSMQSSPVDEYLKMTYAIKGEFTTKMAKELKPGRKVSIKMPYGELFIQKHSKENTVFIAGGTGITPFLSLFTDSSFSNYKNPRLYFGIKHEKHNLYQSALDASCRINPTFLFRIIEENKKGFLDIDRIHKKNGNSTDYFLSGPPVMIDVFKTFLVKQGVPPDHVFSDTWT